MNKRIFAIIILIILLIGLGLGVYLLGQRQDIRQRAAGEQADLEVRMFRLTDAAGNVRTRFYSNEDIYLSVIIRNSGNAVGESTDGVTTSQFYSNRLSPVEFNTVSDVSISLRNGEFGIFDGSGSSQYRYDSRLSGEGQEHFTTTPYEDNATRRYSWRRVEPGTYTARILLNSDKHVTEGNYDNNQGSISYQVVPFGEGAESGGVSTEVPPEFAGPPCINRTAVNLPGVTGCVQQITDDRRNVYSRITNNTATSIRVLLGSFQEYYPWANPTVVGCSRADCPENYLQVWTQTFYRGKETQVPAGATRYISTQVPQCAWQTDIFILDDETSNLPMSFNPNVNIYRRGLKYIDGWYHFYPNNDTGNFQRCEAVEPPLPTTTPTPITTNTPTPGPTTTPRYKVTAIAHLDRNDNCIQDGGRPRIADVRFRLEVTTNASCITDSGGSCTVDNLLGGPYIQTLFPIPDGYRMSSCNDTTRNFTLTQDRTHNYFLTPVTTPTITPTPPACTIPEQVTNVRVSCPTCDS